MGLSGGSKSTTTEYSGSGQKWAQPYAKAAAADIAAGYNAKRGRQDEQTANLFGLADSLLGKFNAGHDNVRAAQGYNTDVLSGKYLEGNPYLQRMIDEMSRGVKSGVNSQFELAGRYGSGAHTGVLADRLAAAEGGLRFQDYNAERARMDSAANSAAPIAAGDNVGLQELLAASGLATDSNFASELDYADALAALFSGGESKRVDKRGSGLLGALAQVGSAAIASDHRLKTNIERVGEYPDGLGIYDFDYLPIEGQIADYMPQGRHRGVMADEVAELRPWALGPVIDGYATVNYEAL